MVVLLLLLNKSLASTCHLYAACAVRLRLPGDAKVNDGWRYFNEETRPRCEKLDGGYRKVEFDKLSGELFPIWTTIPRDFRDFSLGEAMHFQTLLLLVATQLSSIAACVNQLDLAMPSVAECRLRSFPIDDPKASSTFMISTRFACIVLIAATPATNVVFRRSYGPDDVSIRTQNGCRTIETNGSELSSTLERPCKSKHCSIALHRGRCV